MSRTWEQKGRGLNKTLGWGGEWGWGAIEGRGLRSEGHRGWGGGLKGLGMRVDEELGEGFSVLRVWQSVVVGYFCGQARKFELKLHGKP